MEEIISKEELDKLMKIKGKIRGLALKGETEFILKEEGKEGLKKVEDEITRLGLPLERKNLKTMEWYPIGVAIGYFLIYKRLFNWDDEKFNKLGRAKLKLPASIRLFIKYFVSLEAAIKENQRLWRRYFSVGEAEVELNKEKRYSIIRIKNCYLHPLQCQVLKGYLSSMNEIILRTKATCEETKCVHRGDEYHEFLVRW